MVIEGKVTLKRFQVPVQGQEHALMQTAKCGIQVVLWQEETGYLISSNENIETGCETK